MKTRYNPFLSIISTPHPPSPNTSRSSEGGKPIKLIVSNP